MYEFFPNHILEMDKLIKVVGVMMLYAVDLCLSYFLAYMYVCLSVLCVVYRINIFHRVDYLNSLPVQYTVPCHQELRMVHILRIMRIM